MIQIIFHRHKCIGCNACTESAPGRWRMSHKDGKSNLIGSVQKKRVHIAKVGHDEYEANLEASRNCPARIIEVNGQG